MTRMMQTQKQEPDYLGEVIAGTRHHEIPGTHAVGFGEALPSVHTLSEGGLAPGVGLGGGELFAEVVRLTGSSVGTGLSEFLVTGETSEQIGWDDDDGDDDDDDDDLLDDDEDDDDDDLDDDLDEDEEIDDDDDSA